MYRKPVFFIYKSHDNAYQVLQAMCAVSEHAMKSEIDMISLSPKYEAVLKNNTHLLLLALLLVLHTRKNTDGVIFSCIALYYGDSCIISPPTAWAI